MYKLFYYPTKLQKIIEITKYSFPNLTRIFSIKQ